MPTGTIDSAIFKDIFGTEAMRQVWSDGNRIQKYLDFEAGLARAQAKLKIIPQEACDEILGRQLVVLRQVAKRSQRLFLGLRFTADRQAKCHQNKNGKKS